MSKKTYFAHVSIVTIMTLVCALNSSLFAQPATRALAGRVVEGADRTALDGVKIYIDGGLVYGPTGVDGRFFIGEAPVASFRLDAVRTGYTPKAIKVLSDTDNILVRLAAKLIRLGEIGCDVKQTDKRQTGSLCISLGHISRYETDNSIRAGGDVLRSLQTLPSVAIANDVSSQLNIRGENPGRNVVLRDGVPFYSPPTSKSVSIRTAELVDIPHTGPSEDFRVAIRREVEGLSLNLPRKLFHHDIQLTKIDRRDPRYKAVLPKAYYQNIVPDFNINLSDLSIEESEKENTPTPYTDKGNHLWRDLVGFSSLQGLFKNDLLAAGATYLLAEGFELIEPRIDKNVRGPNHYDPLYAAAGYTFHILQQKGLIPENLWWSITFSTDDKPFSDHEHKPMQAELHYTFMKSRVNLDFIAFYNNYGYDPTTKYPFNIRISSATSAESKI